MSDIPTCPQFPARPPHGGEPFIVPPAPRRKPGLSVLSVNGRTPDGHGDLALTYIDGAEYAAGYGNPPRPALLFRQGSEVVAVVDATPLLKDGMVSSVAVSDGKLVITFNTDAGREPVSVPLTEIFDPGAYYDKAAADTLLSGKADKVADATNGHLASLDANGDLADSGKAPGDFLPKTGGTVNGDMEVVYGSTGFTVKDASGNYLRIRHGVVAGDFWYVDYYVANVGSGSLRLPYDNIIPADVYSLAGLFSGSTTYAFNSLCVDSDGRLYRCVNPNGHTGAWVAADFAVATVEDAFAALRTALADKADKSTVYTKAEVDAVVQALKTGSRQVVGTLPASGQPMVIYMVPKSAMPQANNVYDEYIWTAAGAWEKIGDTEIDLSGYYTKADVDALLYWQAQDTAGKADKVANAVDGHLAGLDGSGNLTDSGFAPGDFAAAASLAAVATSGSYDDLADKPTIPAAQVQSDWDEDDTGDPSYIQNKPTALSDFTDDVGYVTDVSDKLDSVAASPAYSASQDYTYGDTVTFEGRRYMCIASISISGGDEAVDPPDDVIHWTERTIDDSFGDKADKVSSAVSGDLAGLDSNGNLTDSGYAPTDFAAASALSGKADKVANATAGNLAALDANGNLTDSGNTVQGTFGCGELSVGYSPNQRFVDILGQGAVLDHCTIIVYNSDYLGHYHHIALPNCDGADKESIFALEREIAPAFDDAATYADGALVYYNDALYRCTTAVTSAGAWTGSTNWTAASVEDVLAALRTALAGKADNAAIATVFSTSATYAVGDVVMYEGARYKCATAVTVAGDWTGSTNWTAESVQEVIGDVESALHTINNGAQS